MRLVLDELRGVLARPHLAGRLAQQQRQMEQAVDSYARLCICVEPLHTPRIVPNDPDDAHVVAAAVQAQAKWIVSGDKRLLGLGDLIHIPVLTPHTALALITRQTGL